MPLSNGATTIALLLPLVHLAAAVEVQAAFVTSCSQEEGGRRSAASRRPAPAAADRRAAVAGDDLELPPAKLARDRIVASLIELEESNANFFDQLELTIAAPSFRRAKEGATAMVSPDGEIRQDQVDLFHAFLEEFLRCMSQLETGPMPRISDYGMPARKRAEELAEPLDLAELRARAKPMVKELLRLRKLANDTVGLGEVGLVDPAKLSPAELVRHVERVSERIHVIMNHAGLGPRFSPAVAATEPLRRDLLRLRQELNRLLDAEGEVDARQARGVGEWLKQCVETAKAMKGAAGLWSSKAHGDRGELILRELERLQRAHRTVVRRR